ncbi:Na+/H+ antiporter subunit D [Niallia nealsonii]|uniref:Na+/H+ antiporter subunit D n=1 Tax=Niallia nealsonii TaxID=115979 RepID=A0A2N0Z299_9BACI|nr:Na+/H+ antiporter subunit D [Niallia nealsonii]PKG23636.1 Na+/H+ antiporter subunit D [Niallia nealsonii]
MSNISIFPIIIPFFTGILLIFFHKHIIIQRLVSTVSLIVAIITSLFLIAAVKKAGVQTLNLSNWEAPFGITLVSDMLSALLVLTTNIVALCCILYSFKGIDQDRESYFYYSLIQFLLVGVIGAFSTGDIFNLFVFFEVMLMSSYALLVIGGTKVQLRETVKYILVNIISSGLFVTTVGYLYSVVGTLNMAHISERLSEVENSGILTVIAVLFLIVFGLKGALFPLFFWMPGSYYAAPIPILALFGALLTKVGVYSIARTFTLFFSTNEYIFTILSILSLITIVLGVIGALAYYDIKKIIIYNILTAVGVILYGVAAFTENSLIGALFYLMHDMIIKTALFLLIGAIFAASGTFHLSKMGGLLSSHPALAWTFFIAAISLAGIPPLSGFIGKLMIIQGGFEKHDYYGSFIVLISSLFVLLSVIKIFIKAFWGTETKTKKPSIKALLCPSIILVCLSFFIGIFSESIYPYISLATETLLHPTNYIEAVLKE